MKQKVFLLFLVIIAVCLLLVACQPQQVEVTRVVTETETVTEEVEVTRVVEGEVVTEVQEVEVTRIVEPEPEEEVMDERGTLRFTDGLAYGGNENLDPVDASRFWPPISLLYDRLTEPAYDNMSPQPSLATSWESNDTGDVWTFQLRDDVFFHDGTQLTSADVAYSANHWKTSETSILASTFEVVDSIETPDDFTIVFNLNSPVVDFPTTVMDYRARVIPEDGLEEILTTGRGSGPFKLERLDVIGTTILVANDDYWDGPPGLKAIEVYGIADVEAQTTALLAGQLDWLTMQTPEQAQRFEGNSDFVISQVPGGNWSGFVMRTDIPPFDNPELRDAMHYVVDRQEMVDLALSEAGTVSCDTAVMPGDPYQFQGDCPQDIEGAQAKLAEAGYADGFEVDLYTSDVCADWTALTEIYQQQAAEAGIDVNITTVSSDGFWTDAWMVQPFVMTCWNARGADAALNEIYRSGGAWNESFWNVPEFDALLDAARAEMDFDARRQYYLDAQQMLHEDGGTIIPYFQNLIRVQKSCVDGIPPLANIWIDWDGMTKDSSCE
ncbi:MAG: peptide ABC transporter substrate-binding protein [Chloroflexi bacterium]|jgi:peptide/nickel transport system substrate-binding protein|nr:peptide ABC transporter substrate-binding protein [Chloroflexota bacterium]